MRIKIPDDDQPLDFITVWHEKNGWMTPIGNERDEVMSVMKCGKL